MTNDKENKTETKRLETASKKPSPSKEAKKTISTFEEEVEPWPESVDLHQLITTLKELIQKHIIVSQEQALAIALWILLTWVIHKVDVLPLLLINAPEKACGKTHLLDLVSKLTRKSMPVANISTGALYRLIEIYEPTLLIDEADMFMNKNAEQAGLINAGHTRTSANVIRCVGEHHEPKCFSVWAAKALAGISLEKHLPNATMSRGIVIQMRRKLPNEKVARLRQTPRSEFHQIKRQCQRFADDYGAQLAEITVELPDALDDRQQDNWEPLCAIASFAGTYMLEQAFNTALNLSSNKDHLSLTVELLMAIREVFEEEETAKLSTSDLIQALCEDEEAPWMTYHQGKPITARQLGAVLNEFQIQSRTLRFNGKSRKGYTREDFDDAFARYIPGDTP